MHAGHVRIDGADVRDVRLAEVRRSVGLVFEDTFLFSDSVRNNIAFADPEAPNEAVVRAARLAGADEFIRELPEGYESIIGEHGYSLSGGQRQRIAIARAVLADPRVLILDDATSSVDPSKEHEIRAALAEVMRGRTTIIIAHRPATIALADRVVLLDGGKVSPTARTSGCSRPRRGTAKCSPVPRPRPRSASSTTKSCSTCRGWATNGLVGRQRSRGDALARRSDSASCGACCGCCGRGAR